MPPKNWEISHTALLAHVALEKKPLPGEVDKKNRNILNRQSAESAPYGHSVNPEGWKALAALHGVNTKGG